MTKPRSQRPEPIVSGAGNRRRLAALALMLGFVLVSAMPAHAQAISRTIGLQNCHLTVDFLKDTDGQRMYREGWLPKTQNLAPFSGWPPSPPGAASLTIWVFDCADAALDGVSVGSVVLSLSAIQIQDRAYAVAPTHWDNYLVWAQTNNAEVAKSLKAEALPVALVPQMRFGWRTDGRATTVDVPWAASPYSLSIRGRIDDVPHTHDNTFQHGSVAGVGPQLELLVDPLVPRDRFCIPNLDPGCMRIATAPGSVMSRFLGQATYTLGADHEVIAHASLKLSAPQATARESAPRSPSEATSPTSQNATPAGASTSRHSPAALRSAPSMPPLWSWMRSSSGDFTSATSKLIPTAGGAAVHVPPDGTELALGHVQRSQAPVVMVVAVGLVALASSVSYLVWRGTRSSHRSRRR